MRSNSKKASLISKILLLSFIVTTIYIGNVIFYPVAIPNHEYQLIISKDQSIANIAYTLEEQNIIKNHRALTLLLRLLRKDKKVTAGMYILKDSISAWSLVKRITNGKPDQISITIADGWNIVTLRNYINSLDNIKHLSINMSESELRSALNIHALSLEGLFYPSTYFIAPGQTDLEIYENAYKMMQNKVDDIYSHKNGYASINNSYQLLILASLIEKETGDKDDMFLVSTVFSNRLRVGMKLQDDPAVFYGLHNKMTITRKDFLIDTPYNTYTHFGLPPTPICIPSLNALIAASQPESKTNIYYFVAVDGKTKFSETYKEHVSKVKKILKNNSKHDNKLLNTKKVPLGHPVMGAGVQPKNINNFEDTK